MDQFIAIVEVDELVMGQANMGTFIIVVLIGFVNRLE